MRKLLALLFILASTIVASAQWQVPQGHVPIGRGVGVTGFTSSPCATISATATGSPNAIALVPSATISALNDCMTFEFIAPFTSTFASFVTVSSIAGVSGGPWSVRGTDGNFAAFAGDIQSGQTLIIRWDAGKGVFLIVTPFASTNNFNAAFSYHGLNKLQASTNTLISFGGGAAFYNSTTGAYQLSFAGPGPCGQELFNNTAIVDGVPGQSLLNEMYVVYLEPQVAGRDPGINPATNACLSFWRGTTAGSAWTTNGHGFYVKANDPARVYLGLVRPVGGSIANVIAPAATMGPAVYPHFTEQRWKFGYQSTVVSCSISSSSFATCATPFLGVITESIDSSPAVRAHTVATCDTSGATVTMRIRVGATEIFSGASATVFSTVATETVGFANKPIDLNAKWESAPDNGYYTYQIDGAVSAGTCSFSNDLLGHVAN